MLAKGMISLRKRDRRSSGVACAGDTRSSALEEVGHTSVAQDGGRKLYSITPQGEAHLAEQRGTADAILQALSRIGRRMDGVREAFAGVSDLDADGSDELQRARHNLKRALRSKQGSDSAEARRIAGILERAVAEILGK